MVALDEIPPFLLGLELRVARDGSAPGFQGALAIGEEREGGAAVWWIFEAGARPSARFQRAHPEAVDCAVLLSSGGARVLAAEGDARVFERFASRYGPRRSVLAVRAGVAR